MDHGNCFHLHFHDKAVEGHHLHCPVDAQVVVAEVLAPMVHVHGGVVVEVLVAVVHVVWGGGGSC